MSKERRDRFEDESWRSWDTNTWYASDLEHFICAATKDAQMRGESYQFARKPYAAADLFMARWNCFQVETLLPVLDETGITYKED